MVQAEIAVIRFGLGARPGELAAAAADPFAWLSSQTTGVVSLTSSIALAPCQEIFAAIRSAREEMRAMKRDATSTLNPLRDTYLPHYRAQVLARAQSAALTTKPFAERLVHFWANHFAVSTDKSPLFGLAGTLENEAIRPHVNGRFVDLLTAVEQHPAMIAFLDNQNSVGANSETSRRAEQRQAKRKFGINENLAREILELHTLGVRSGYTQIDVTTFANIITGWSISETGRFFFRENAHEPGAKIFMGKSYTQDGQAQGEAVLADLVHHPATAQFIATKLCRHFIADEPPPATVSRVAHAFMASGGDLRHVYAALIETPEAWDSRARKFKTPEDFVFSTLRGLNISPSDPQLVVRDFELLGQRQYTPGSPAGWPDTAKSWDGSDALMHRVLWASRIAARYEQGSNPLEVATSCLGTQVRPETRSALRRAASASQALALLLMSPEFQRR